jgi:hypothetical protein
VAECLDALCRRKFFFSARRVSSPAASECIGPLTSPTRTQTQPTKQEAVPAQASLEEQLSDAGHDRAVVNAEIAQRDEMIAVLRRQLARQSAETNEMKAAQNQLQGNLRVG